jgi:Skp family chaperone for outer membrane proteins
MEDIISKEERYKERKKKGNAEWKKEKEGEKDKNEHKNERRKRESTQLQTHITKCSTETPEVLTTTPTSFIAGDEDITVS